MAGSAAGSDRVLLETGPSHRAPSHRVAGRRHLAARLRTDPTSCRTAVRWWDGGVLVPVRFWSGYSWLPGKLFGTRLIQYFEESSSRLIHVADLTGERELWVHGRTQWAEPEPGQNPPLGTFWAAGCSSPAPDSAPPSAASGVSSSLQEETRSWNWSANSLFPQAVKASRGQRTHLLSPSLSAGSIFWPAAPQRTAPPLLSSGPLYSKCSTGWPRPHPEAPPPRSPAPCSDWLICRHQTDHLF